DFLPEEISRAFIQLCIGVRSCCLLRGRLKAWRLRSWLRSQRRNQRIENYFFNCKCSLFFYLLFLLRLDEVHCLVYKIADHAFYVASNIAHFRELCCFHLYEGSIGNARKPARDFRLTDTRSTNHQYVVGNNFPLHVGLDTHPPPPVAKCNRDVALGIVLTNNVFVQLLNNLLGRQVLVIHHSIVLLLNIPLISAARVRL